MKRIKFIPIKPAEERQCMTEVLWLSFKEGGKTIDLAFEFEYSSCEGFIKPTEDNKKEGMNHVIELFEKFKSQFNIENLPYIVEHPRGIFKVTEDNFESIKLSRYNSWR